MHMYFLSFFLYHMSIAIFLSIYLPKTCDKSGNSDEMCVQLWSLSIVEVSIGSNHAKAPYRAPLFDRATAETFINAFGLDLLTNEVF